jgi:hypothetical protein
MPNHEVTIEPITEGTVIQYKITVALGTHTRHASYETLEAALDSFEPPLSARVRSHVVEAVRGGEKSVMFCLEDSFEIQ